MVRYGWRALDRVFMRIQFASFGKRSCIQRPRTIVGAEHIKVGDNVLIWPGSRIEAVSGERDNISLAIGSGTKIQPNVHIAAAHRVEIGRGVLVASGVYITDHDHDVSDPDVDVVSNTTLITAPVYIGDSVWLGERVIVLKGVRIGHRSVIGAGSVVTRDVPPYSIAVGTPARVVKRFDRVSGVWSSV